MHEVNVNARTQKTKSIVKRYVFGVETASLIYMYLHMYIYVYICMYVLDLGF